MASFPHTQRLPPAERPPPSSASPPDDVEELDELADDDEFDELQSDGDDVEPEDETAGVLVRRVPGHTVLSQERVEAMLYADGAPSVFLALVDQCSCSPATTKALPNHCRRKRHS